MTATTSYTDLPLLSNTHHWVRGQEGCQVRLHANGAHAWASTSVRDAEGLVEVEMAHVSTNVAGTGEAHLP